MIVDRKWMERNIGFDPVKTPAPAAIYANKAAARPTASLDEIQRDIIDFDSEGPEGAAFLAFTNATGLSRFTDIPWPSGLAPQTAAKAPGTGKGALPRADVLIVTWTVDEGHALSRVLTPGKDSRDDYVSYTHNFAAISKGMSRGSPAVKAKRLGAFWTTTIAGKTVLVFKSDSHLSQDTDKHFPANGVLPNAQVWRQIIAETQPKLVITTGTAGGIGADFEVGDVVVSPTVRFDSQKWLKPASFSKASYSGKAANRQFFEEAKTLFAANAGQLPKDNARPPTIVVGPPGALPSSIVTTDFFGFDTTDNHFQLQGMGDACEMGDAVLGMVANELGAQAPVWIAVRNVSDPRIKSDGLNITQEGDMANKIYKAFGRWSSVCSAIVCWAVVAAL
jgi:purine-nucleoside phosphorylase